LRPGRLAGRTHRWESKARLRQGREGARQLDQSWLTRGLPLDPQPTVPLSDAELQKYAGSIFGLSRVAVGQGKLVLGGKDVLPTGQGSFRRSDRSEATLAFVEQDGRVFKINATSAQQKVPPWQMIGLWLLGAILVLSPLVGSVMLIPRVIAYRRGRLADKACLYFRLLPLVAIAPLAATLALPLLALSNSGSTSVQQLASIGPYSLLILFCSVLYPLLALTGMVSTVRNQAAPD